MYINIYFPLNCCIDYFSYFSKIQDPFDGIQIDRLKSFPTALLFLPSSAVTFILPYSKMEEFALYQELISDVDSGPSFLCAFVQGFIIEG